MSQGKKPTDPAPPENAVQDYLDLLLSPLASVSLPDAETKTAEAEEPNKIAPSPEKNAPLKKSDEGESPHYNGATDSGGMVPKTVVTNSVKQRPFAEPAKPLTVKMPLPKIQQVEPPSAPVSAKTVTAKPSKPSSPAPVQSKAVPAPVVSKATPPPAELKETAPKVRRPIPAPTPTPKVPEEPNQQTQPIEQVERQTESSRPVLTSWKTNGRPEWAQERFECLLFYVGGLSLAVPLSELGAIHPFNDQFTPLFGQANWFMGLLTIKDSNIRTVNTAKLVMPERYREEMDKDFSYVISINGVDWGLAVDNVAQAIALEPSDVRWRSERSKRPWLAGTVVDHMCALLDVSQLAGMFWDEDHSK